MTDYRHQIERDVGAALECAESTTWKVNELVARTLPTAVTGKEAATTLHHAYSAQYHLARVFEWSKEWRRFDGTESFKKLSDSIDWTRRALDHADKLCRCFPTLEKVEGKADRPIMGWADRWPEDYAEVKSCAQNLLEKIKTALNTFERQQSSFLGSGLKLPES
jgi:hypothetical protein